MQANRVMHYRIETCFAESHAAAIKHSVIKMEKTTGRRKYLQLTTVMAAKQRANAQGVPPSSVTVAAENSSDSIQHRCFHCGLHGVRPGTIPAAPFQP